jgi:hypothetical protein
MAADSSVREGYGTCCSDFVKCCDVVNSAIANVTQTFLIARSVHAAAAHKVFCHRCRLAYNYYCVGLLDNVGSYSERFAVAALVLTRNDKRALDAGDV